MKTKVWIVIWGLKDGGAEVLARDYARLVDPQRFDATVVTMYPFTNTANYRRAKEAGVNIRSVFGKRNVLTRAMRVLLGSRYISMVLRRMLAQEKPNVIHFNSQMALYFAPIKNRLSDIRLIYTCHSELHKHFFETEELAVRQLIQEPGLRLVALHENMKRELNDYFGKDDTVVIRNGVDLRRFQQVEHSKDAIRRNIGILEEAYVVGHVGRFTEAKNHAFLLRVFEKIVQRKPKAHLLLVGSGELRAEVEEKIAAMHLEQRVTILSHRTDIPELLRAMDVMVFPSFYEGLSVTLVEAQASGLKCVVSDAVNPESFLSDRILPVSLEESPDVWADIALNDALRNETYGNLENYDMNREIHRLERLYQGEADV